MYVALYGCELLFLQGVEPVVTTPFQSVLHSLGGIQVGLGVWSGTLSIHSWHTPTAGSVPPDSTTGSCPEPLAHSGLYAEVPAAITEALLTCSSPICSAKLLSLLLNIARSSNSYLQHLVQMNALNLINHLLKKVGSVAIAAITFLESCLLPLPGFPLTPVL